MIYTIPPDGRGLYTEQKNSKFVDVFNIDAILLLQAMSN